MRESALELKVVEFCRANGVLCYKFSSPARRGVPDRILLYRGRVLFLEIKAPGKTPSKLQQREAGILDEAGFTCAWCDELEEAQKMITAELLSPDVL